MFLWNRNENKTLLTKWVIWKSLIFIFILESNTSQPNISQMSASFSSGVGDFKRGSWRGEFNCWHLGMGIFVCFVLLIHYRGSYFITDRGHFDQNWRILVGCGDFGSLMILWKACHYLSLEKAHGINVEASWFSKLRPAKYDQIR